MKNYRKQTGWIALEGKRYYLDQNGVMVHDIDLAIDGVTFRFGSDGAVIQ
jgi:glucan-binding YG repeat protein